MAGGATTGRTMGERERGARTDIAGPFGGPGHEPRCFYPPLDRLSVEGHCRSGSSRAGYHRAMTRSEDDGLRSRALEALGPLGDPLAREALERGVVAVEAEAVIWEGTQGTMRGHRIVLILDAELLARANASHATRDAVTAALSAAMAERAGHAVSDVRLELGAPAPRASSPYRDR